MYSIFQVQVRKRAQAHDKGTDEAANKSQRQKPSDQEVSVVVLISTTVKLDEPYSRL